MMVTSIRTFAFATATILLLSVPLCAQVHVMKSPALSTIDAEPTPPSNSISHVNTESSIIWIGTSKGLGRSSTGARTWQSFGSDPAFATSGIFAIAVSHDTVWAATGFNRKLDDGSVQTGSGYAFSTDAGASWQHRDQTLDQRGDSVIAYGINDSVRVLPVIVPEQNVTFDISLSPGTVWIASWASGLRKSTDRGATWERILLPLDDRNRIAPTDTLWTIDSQGRRVFQRFDPRRNNNMLAFSVLALDDDTIWCGTAGGVNKSTDGGRSWIRLTHQNQSSPILGNWVIALAQQRFELTRRIWTTNWRATESSENFGVSYSDDGGRIWTNILHGIRAYDFAFKDSIAYIATEEGIFRTGDGGVSFIHVSYIADPSTHQLIASSKVFSVGVIGDTVYVGTDDGMASTIDNADHAFGEHWTIYRTYQSVGSQRFSYAYPNPYAPQFGGVRIHYRTQGGSANQTVSVELFDYGMNRVRTLVNNASRPANTELEELWDGRTDDNQLVSNGVYFYRLQIDGEDPLFGKILVIQ
jgi:photosystem II stability/assembly factor-like uncharacterized protein